MEESGFVPVTAIFYAVFHPTEGTKVLHQIPSGAIVPSAKPDSSTLEVPLIQFDSIKNYVIPKPQFCNRLITVKSGTYRVIGYPVNIYGSQYARNSFSFNFCFVFPYDSDTIPYEDHIRRIGRMFRTLEEQSNLLTKKIEQEDSSIFFKNEDSKASTSSTPPASNPQDTRESLSTTTTTTTGSASGLNSSNTNGHYLQEVTDVEGVVRDMDNWNAITPGVKKNVIELTSIDSLIHQIFQDLNNYSECQIPIDSSNSVDIKLFPIFPPPPDINSFDVPIQTVKLKSLVDLNWDPTMVNILPYINGINSVKRISQLADLDYNLVKQCIQHLMHYKCIMILDIFQFSNMYLPTSNIGLFLEDSELATECQAYVTHELLFNGSLAIPAKKLAIPSDDNNSINSSAEKLAAKLESTSSSSNNLKSKNTIVVPSKANIFYLYRSLHHGQNLRDWSVEHAELLRFIDIRRLISFGVLRNLIYRVHSFPVSDTVTGVHHVSQARKDSELRNEIERDNSVLGELDDKFVSSEDVYKLKKKQTEESTVIKSLKKVAHFDAICTDMGKSRFEVELLLNGLGDWNLINS